MKTDVCVIGCGPAGLLAAHAARRAGLTFFILAPEVQPSFIAGAQYLHTPIPDLTEGMWSFELEYVRLGDADTYARKIYGHRVSAEATSWSRFPDRVQAWSMQRIYDRLWDMYWQFISPAMVTPDSVKDLKQFADIVFNTAPVHAIAPYGAVLTSEEVLIEVDTHMPDVTPNQIVYYGIEEVPAYRSSLINGYGSIEYPGSMDLPGAKRIVKPLRAVGAEVPGVHMLGRYGKWQKGVLVDDAFREATEIIKARSSHPSVTTEAG